MDAMTERRGGKKEGKVGVLKEEKRKEGKVDVMKGKRAERKERWMR